MKKLIKENKEMKRLIKEELKSILENIDSIERELNIGKKDPVYIDEKLSKIQQLVHMARLRAWNLKMEN